MLHVVDKDVLLEWSKTVQHLLVLYTTLICYSNIKEVQLTESSLYWHTQIYHTLMVPWLLAATTTLEPCSNRIERKGLAGNQSHFTAEMFQHRAIRQTAKLIKKRIMTKQLEIQKSWRNGCILSLKSTRTCVPDWESGKKEGSFFSDCLMHSVCLHKRQLHGRIKLYWMRDLSRGSFIVLFPTVKFLPH